MKLCKKCGNEINSNAAFCSNCGTKNDDSTSKSEPLKADIKVEVTNATTEKVFKKVGDTISEGKKTVQTTTRFIKGLILPMIVFGSLAGGMIFLYDQEQRKKRDVQWAKDIKEARIANDKKKRAEERELQKFERNRLHEEKLCVVNAINSYNNNPSNLSRLLGKDKWDAVKFDCVLTYTEIEKYKKMGY